MRFELPQKYGRNWDKEKYEEFCKLFNVKGVAFSSPGIITNSASCLARALSETTPFRMRMSEALCETHDCFDDFETLLFDHAWFFKTKDNIRFLFSTPYSTWDLSANRFFELQHKFKVLNGIEIYLVDEKLKFIPNGDIALIFIAWPYHRKYFSKILTKGVGGNRLINDGKVQGDYS